VHRIDQNKIITLSRKKIGKAPPRLGSTPKITWSIHFILGDVQPIVQVFENH